MQGDPSVEPALEAARALLRERRLGDAVTLLRRTLQSHPAEPVASFLLGAALAEQRDFTAARAILESAFARTPAQPPAHHLLFANVLLDSRDAVAAESHARRALGAAPGWPPAQKALAAALRQRARQLHGEAQLSAALPLYREALALDARDPDAWNELGVALTDAGLLDAARGAYREALQRRPGYSQVESNLLINLHYDPSIDAAKMFEAHREWAKRHAAELDRMPLPPRDTSAVLRVGFLSPAFTQGPTAAFVEPVLRHLDRARFQVVGYNVGRRDSTSERLAGLCAEWRELWQADDEDVARRIAEDRIDVLVDLAGHTPGGRPLVLARKPAPRIATWLDYFDTTGLVAVDALLGDPVSTPRDGRQRFTERLVLLEPSRLCYTPPAYAPAVADPPLVRNGYATFGSFNRYSKLAPPVLDAWSAVLHGVPRSRLLVKCPAFADSGLRESFARAMADRGIDAARLDLRGASPHAQMLAEYGDVDVALDSFPYNGGLTTCEALWMGVPVVAIEGEAMISRQSASLLKAAGLDDWVARDAADYAARAALLARDAKALGARRAGLRDRLAQSPLLDGARFAKRFEAALEAVHAGNL